jgi:hypothetical protein
VIFELTERQKEYLRCEVKSAMSMRRECAEFHDKLIRAGVSPVEARSLTNWDRGFWVSKVVAIRSFARWLPYIS